MIGLHKSMATFNSDSADGYPWGASWEASKKRRFTGRCQLCGFPVRYVREEIDPDTGHLLVEFECERDKCKQKVTLITGSGAFDNWENDHTFYDITDALSLLIDDAGFPISQRRYYLNQIDIMIAYLLRLKAKGSLKISVKKGGKSKNRGIVFRRFK